MQQFILPHEQAVNEMAKINGQLKKHMNAQRKREKKGKFIQVPGVYPRLAIFITNKDLKLKKLTKKLLEDAKTNYLANRVTCNSRPV